MSIASIDSHTPENKSSNLFFSEAVQQWVNNSATKLKGGTKKKYSQLLQTHILPELGKILGHANVSITLNTYVHSSIEMKKSQLEKLAKIMC